MYTVYYSTNFTQMNATRLSAAGTGYEAMNAMVYGNIGDYEEAYDEQEWMKVVEQRDQEETTRDKTKFVTTMTTTTTTGTSSTMTRTRRHPRRLRHR